MCLTCSVQQSNSIDQSFNKLIYLNVNFLDNIKKINQKFEQVKKHMKKKTRSPSTSPETTRESHISSKRSRKPNAKYNSNSFDNLGFVKPPKEVQVPKLVCFSNF